jgi:hypothetical protein
MMSQVCWADGRRRLKSGVIADELPQGRQNFHRRKPNSRSALPLANLQLPSSATIVDCGAQENVRSAKTTHI